MSRLASIMWNFRIMASNKIKLPLWVSLGAFLYTALACTAISPHPWQNEAYHLFQFDSETGSFDPSIDKDDLKSYWKQWKKARRFNFILNPDNAHGRQCGTYQYLHSKWLLKTPFLPKYSFFLIRPGKHPCDYDETCSAAEDIDATTCAHTQYLLDFPVIIDPTGNPYHQYSMNTEFFNALIQSQAMTIETVAQAAQLARLYVYLTTTGSRNTVSRIVMLQVESEEKRFLARAQLSVPTEPEKILKEFFIAADGSVMPSTDP